MLTVFSVPKPFAGHVGVIQRNAIRSWSVLHRDIEVVLCGDEPGTKDMASEVGATYLPHVSRNQYGTPLLNSVFEEAERASHSSLMCYVNADIVLLSDFIPAVRRIAFRRFLMVGQRWDVDLTASLDVARPDWQRALRTVVHERGTLHPPMGSDYFVFPTHSGLSALPPFAVGRPEWDNWFIYHARRQGVPVIDATRAVRAIHQNHGYGHVPQRRDDAWEGPEADMNRELVGGWDHVYTLADASHVLTPTWLLPAAGSAMRRWIRTGIYRCRRSASVSLRAYRRLRQGQV